MKNIFVGNLSFSVTEQTLRSLFEIYGAVGRVNLVADRDSAQPRGFAFVEMTNMPKLRRPSAPLTEEKWKAER